MSSSVKSKVKSDSSKLRSSEKGKKKAVRQKTEPGHLDLALSMKNCVREDDLEKILSIQKRSLKNFSKTNEQLGIFNDFSSSKYMVLQHKFVQHTRLLVELKHDLTNVFLRIRRLKVKLQKQYPQAFEATFNLRQALENALENEVPEKPTYDSGQSGGNNGVTMSPKTTTIDNETGNTGRSDSEHGEDSNKEQSLVDGYLDKNTLDGDEVPTNECTIQHNDSRENNINLDMDMVATSGCTILHGDANEDDSNLDTNTSDGEIDKMVATSKCTMLHCDTSEDGSYVDENTINDEKDSVTQSKYNVSTNENTLVDGDVDHSITKTSTISEYGHTAQNNTIDTKIKENTENIFDGSGVIFTPQSEIEQTTRITGLSDDCSGYQVYSMDNDETFKGNSGREGLSNDIFESLGDNKVILGAMKGTVGLSVDDLGSQCESPGMEK